MQTPPILKLAVMAIIFAGLTDRLLAADDASKVLSGSYSASSAD